MISSRGRPGRPPDAGLRLRAGQQLEQPVQRGDAVPVPVGVVPAEAARRVRVGSGADAQLQPPVGQRVDDGRVLGDAPRVLQRQRDDGGAEPDPLRVLRDGGQQHERRRQQAAEMPVVVLGDPERVEAEPVRLHRQLDRLPERARGRIPCHMREVAQPHAASLGGRDHR